MNLLDLTGDLAKPLAATRFFKAEKGDLKIIRLNAGAELAEHKSPVEARLVLLAGSVVFEYKNGPSHELRTPFEVVEIQPDAPHRVLARADSFCLLIQ